MEKFVFRVSGTKTFRITAPEIELFYKHNKVQFEIIKIKSSGSLYEIVL